MEAGRRGGVLWRNNVGATKAKEVHTCPRCSFRFEIANPPLRYGLCNDSEKLNKRIKSSDLIGIKQVLIGPQHVGTIIGQFHAVEVKAPGEPINLRDERQKGQAAFGQLVERFNGSFEFSHGSLL
ncbi:gp62 [Vibrio phage CKB-S1]|nr:gp62 [Vibrio phage CKB-S1]